MYHKPTRQCLLVLAGITLLACASTSAQSTYTWANSNVTGTPSASLDWFGAGQGTWIGGDPISSNLNTIQIFENTTTALPNTAVPSTQTINLNNGGSAFQLGTLTLSGRGSATASANLTMTLSGDALNFSGSTGTINLNGVNNTRSITYDVANNIQLGTGGSLTALTFTGNGNNTFGISGDITESFAGSSLIKSGTSSIRLSGTNTYSGGTFINAGSVTIASHASLGSASGGLTLNGGTLVANVGSNPGTTTRAVTIDSGGGTFSMSNGDRFETTGKLSGSGKLTFTGGGTFGARYLSFLGTTNDFTGEIEMSGRGYLITVGSLGDGGRIIANNGNDNASFTFTGGTSALVFNSRQFEMKNASATRGNLAIINNSSSSNATFQVNTDLLVTTTAVKTLTLSGTHTGSNSYGGAISNGSSSAVSLTKSGAGTWVLSGTNTYTGNTSVSAGLLNVTGSLTSNVTVANGATLAGTGATTGTLVLDNGSTIVGTTTGNSFMAETVTATSSVKVVGSDGSGTIGSHTIGIVRYNSGTGPTTTNFSTAGYHAGASISNVGGAGGETQLTYTNAARTWNSASGTWDAMVATTWQEGDFKFGHGDAVTFNDSGAGGGSARAVTLNSLITPGSVTFDNSTSTPYTVSGTGNISGLTGLTKTGTGTVTLSTINTYTGATTVTNGTLIVNGSIANSATTVSGTGTIAGTGTVGALTIAAGGTHNPGNSPGIMYTGNYNMAGTLNIEAIGNTAGSGYDQVNVTGSVTLSGDLVAAFSAGTYAEGDLLFILLNDAGDAVSGTFNGLAQGAVVTSYDGYDWQISYVADSSSSSFSGGNDVALMAVAIPEPSALLLGMMGGMLLLRRRR